MNQKIALKTLKDLNVDLIDYPWVSADIPPCVGRPNDTYVLLKPDRLAEDAVRIFYAESPHSDDKQLGEQLMLETFFLHVKPGAEQSGSTAPETAPEQYKLWPELDSKAVGDRDFQIYLASAY